MLLGETTIHESDDGTELIMQRDLEGQSVELEELDEFPGAIRTPSGEVWKTSSGRDARLAFGLWQRVGPFDLDVDDDVVPIEVAAASRADLAAYLTLRPGRPSRRVREHVRKLLGLESKQSVSNYLNDVRISWDDVLEE